MQCFCFRFRHLACAAALALGLLPQGARALDIAQVPLVAGSAPPANLLYIHDDSGSMDYLYMPDGVNINSANATADPSKNSIYYDPSQNYPPPVDHNGNSLGNADFNAAWFDGYDLAGRNATGGLTCITLNSELSKVHKINLATQFRVISASCNNPADPAGHAYYRAGGSNIKIPADQQQNFANWYSYYRKRNYAAKAGVSRAFANLPANVRVGYGRINKEMSKSGWDGGVPVRMIEQGVRPFTGKQKKAFYDWLFQLQPSGGTPLRLALQAAGIYFDRSATGANAGPWADDPATGKGTTNTACRKSFAILMTDGYYNDDESIANVGNSDYAYSPSFTTPKKSDGSTETWSTKSFADDYSNTLGDIAWRYYVRDLYPDEANNQVVGTARDPAWWQHMTTFAIGLGVEGGLDKDDTFRKADAGAKISWPSPSTGTAKGKIDDLLHAAVNGRGDFFSAQNPREFSDGMAAIISSITVGINAFAPVAASSTSMRTDTQLFQATFDGAGWFGELKAYGLGADGSVNAAPDWNASIPAHASRNIFTWNPASADGAVFAWASLSSAQQAQLGSQNALNYLRGDTANESPNGLGYRSRGGHRLGDIINSAPLFVGSPVTDNYGYSYAASIAPIHRASYLERRTASAASPRPGMVYVGANDGMLHAFDAESGAERFAYVPNGVFANLEALTKTNYTHRYYVDGSPNAGDILIGGDWRTVLVGSTGAGGKAYFALDVETPEAFNQDKALWEVSDASAGFEHLGVAIGQASIARLNNGAWAVVFGNGYNSSDGEKASLFIVDAATGDLIKEIRASLSAEPTPAANGLSTPLLVDYNQDGTADAAYAGDLLGRLWKFDLSGASAADWGLAFSGNPLFSAMDAGGKAQPITAKPQAIRHADGATMVYAGTGSFFVTGDNINTSVQTFYGIHDDGARGNITRGSLVAQTMTQFSDASGEYRFVSENAVDYKVKQGFYLDLKTTGSATGERLISTPIVWEDRVIFNTLIPSSNTCSGGIDGWLMEVDPFSGARLLYSVFDLNGDGFFNSLDFKSGKPVSGRKVGSGSGFTPVGSNKYGLDGDGGIQKVANNPVGFGRQSWKQIR
ncbi:MAG: hypothetical protein LBD68_06345 [Zoogloeaceae bacterium]|nr:hypothetical protein [Zoogloeaceae bacterium]